MWTEEQAYSRLIDGMDTGILKEPLMVRRLRPADLESSVAELRSGRGDRTEGQGEGQRAGGGGGGGGESGHSDSHTAPEFSVMT